MHAQGFDSRRALVGPIIAGATVVGVIVWLFAAALHDPRPHDIRVALVAPTQVADRVTATLAERSPGAFALTRLDSAAEAEEAITSRDVSGAFVVDPSGASILVAGGAGEATSGAIRGAFGGIAEALGQPTTVRDVRPLPSGDPHGVVPFFLVLGVAVSALVFAGAAYTLGRGRVRPTIVIAALLVFAVVDGLTAAVAVGSVVGFEPGFWLLATVCGTLALAVAAATAACQRIMGMAGTAVAAVFVVLLGAASSGGPAGPEFLPDAFRALSPLLPPGAGIAAVRSAQYFDGAGLAGPLTVLGAWIVIALAVVIGGAAWVRRGHPATAPAVG